MLVRIVAPVRGERGLNACLQALMELDVTALKSGVFPALYASGVRYRREPLPVREQWKTVPAVLRDGHGDCEDLATWRAAELVVTGQDPAARPVLVRTGRGWHVVVRRGDGSTEDPSRLLGMGRPWKQ